MAKTKINVVALINRKNIDDDDKAYAVQRELQENLSAKGYDVILHEVVTNAEALSTLPRTLNNSGDYSIVVGGGEHCIAPLVNLKQAASLTGTLYTSWSGHQLFDSLPAAAPHIDSIGLPDHIDSSPLPADKLIKTVGVIHNSTPEILAAEYEKVKTRLLPAKKYLFVYLAGDAPMPDGTMLYYTAAEAQALGKHVAHNIDRNTVIIATNGPHTGQHILDDSIPPQMIKVPHNHCDIDPATFEKRKMDAVSAAFITGLHEGGVSVSCDTGLPDLPRLNSGNDMYRGEMHHAGILIKKRAQFFDFRFVNEKGNSVYKGLLGAVAATPGSRILLAGESISALTEAYNLLPAGAVIVYTNNAMNPDHYRYLQSLDKNGQVHVLEMAEAANNSISFDLKPQNNQEGNTKYPRASKIMADRAVDDVERQLSNRKQQLLKGIRIPDLDYSTAIKQSRMLPCSDGFRGAAV
jgi:hypothetical protein